VEMRLHIAERLALSPAGDRRDEARFGVTQ
jgi:hypothetical protein